MCDKSTLKTQKNNKPKIKKFKLGGKKGEIKRNDVD